MFAKQTPHQLLPLRGHLRSEASFYVDVMSKLSNTSQKLRLGMPLRPSRSEAQQFSGCRHPHSHTGHFPGMARSRYRGRGPQGPTPRRFQNDSIGHSIIIKYSFPSISHAIVSVIETKQQIFTRNAKLNISKRVYLCTCTKGCQNKTTEWKCVVLAKYDRKRRVFCVRLRKHSSMVTVLIRLEVRA